MSKLENEKLNELYAKIEDVEGVLASYKKALREELLSIAHPFSDLCKLGNNVRFKSLVLVDEDGNLVDMSKRVRDEDDITKWATAHISEDDYGTYCWIPGGNSEMGHPLTADVWRECNCEFDDCETCHNTNMINYIGFVSYELMNKDEEN